MPSALIMTGPISWKEIVSPSLIRGMEGSLESSGGKSRGTSLLSSGSGSWTASLLRASPPLAPLAEGDIEGGVPPGLILVLELSVDMANAASIRMPNKGMKALPVFKESARTSGTNRRLR